MGKTERFTGLNTDLERLANRTEVYLQENKFEVAFSKDPTEPASWFFIQARKAGALRTAAGARRSTDIAIRGSPNSFEVSIGTGEWGKNLASSIPLFIVPMVGIGATVAKLYTAKKFESGLWKFIREQARFLSDSAKRSAGGGPSPSANVDSRVYESDYVEGYPGWRSPVREGKLLLVREKDGKNRLVFKGGGQELTIPAESIQDATIVSRKKGLNEHDLMIQLIVKEQGGKTIRPVFNVRDDLVRAVLTGIDEIASEDKVLRSLENAHVSTEVKYCSNCGASIQKQAKFCAECGKQQ
jgi:hypothetical protein